jgi:hypothetical protein
VKDQAAYKAERARPIQQMPMLVCALLVLANLIFLLGIGVARSCCLVMPTARITPSSRVR